MIRGRRGRDFGRSWVAPLAALGASLLYFGGAARADVPEAPPSQRRQAEPLSFSTRLPEGGSRLGLLIERRGSALSVRSCSGRAPSCVGLPSRTLDLELPVELRKARISATPIEFAGGHQLLDLSFSLGKDGRSYHFILRGAKSIEAAPELLLRGEAGGESGRWVRILGRAPNMSLTIAKVLEKAACGRDLPIEVMRYDSPSEAFVSARLPIFSAKERKEAPTVAPLSEEPKGRSLRPRTRDLPGSESGWTDGVVEGEPSDAFAFLAVVLGPSESTLSVQSQGESRLWLYESGKLSVLALPSGQSYFSLAPPVSPGKSSGPAEAPSNERCVLLSAADSEQTPLELKVVDAGKTPIPAAGLLRELDQASGEEAEAILRSLWPLHEELSGFLERDLSTLGGRTRKRILRSEWPAAARSEISLSFALHGSPEERELGRVQLFSDPLAGAVAISRRLQKKRFREEAPLFRLLSDIDPAAALAPLLASLDVPSASRRLALRKILRDYLLNPELRPLLTSELSQEKHSRSSRIELLRIYEGERGPWEKEVVAVLDSLVMGQLTFQEAYRLLPLIVRSQEQSQRRDVVGHILRDADAGLKLSAGEAVALRVHLLEILAGLEDGAQLKALVPALHEALRQDSPRVRQAALRALGHPESPQSAQPILDLLDEEPWPSVRVEAVSTLSSFLDRQDHLEAETAVRKRLGSDDSPLVRRSAARGLAQGRSEESLEALRDAVEEDTDVGVRAAAILALGARCDGESLDAFSDRALTVASRDLDVEQLELAWASLRALHLLNPPDLEVRLRSLFSEKVPLPLRAQIRGILSGHGKQCPRGSAKAP